MPENGFLQGLFLQEQIKNSQRNQQMQIDSNREAQTRSQNFSREQGLIQNNQFLASLAEQRKQREALEANQQFMRQFQMAGAMAQDQFRLPNAAGLPQFLDQGMPAPQGDFQVAPPATGADPEAPPMFTQTPRMDSTYATAQMPAPEGSLFKIGDQQIMIPSKGQRIEEDIAAKHASFEAQSNQMFERAKAFIQMQPDLTQTERSDIMQHALFPGSAPKAPSTLQAVASRAFEKYKEAQASGHKTDAAHYYGAVKEAYALMMGVEQARATGRINANPLPQLEVQSRTVAGKIYQMATLQLQKSKGSGFGASDIRAEASRMLRDPNFNKGIDSNLITRVETLLQDSTFNPNTDGTIQDNVDKMTGGRTSNTEPTDKDLIQKFLEKNR